MTLQFGVKESGWTVEVGQATVEMEIGSCKVLCPKVLKRLFACRSSFIGVQKASQRAQSGTTAAQSRTAKT